MTQTQPQNLEEALANPKLTPHDREIILERSRITGEFNAHRFQADVARSKGDVEEAEKHEYHAKLCAQEMKDLPALDAEISYHRELIDGHADRFMEKIESGEEISEQDRVDMENWNETSDKDFLFIVKDGKPQKLDVPNHEAREIIQEAKNCNTTPEEYVRTLGYGEYTPEEDLTEAEASEIDSRAPEYTSALSGSELFKKEAVG